MGAGESNPVRNMDKRTARREYKDDFSKGIQQYRSLLKYRENLNAEATADDDALIEEEEWKNGDIRVYVRKRPIFRREIDLGEFDVITCFDSKTIYVHDARMHTDMKRQMINHHKFQFDRVFNEKTDNLTVYNSTTAPLVKIAADGGFATCFVYGQTGSGKTFTMSAIYEQAVYELFVQLEAKAALSEAVTIPKVSVSFFEIAGDDCHDLLNSFAEVQLFAGVDGSFHPTPIVEAPVSGPEELLAFINHGRNVRPTAATGVHDASSRSHAVLRIYIHLDDLDSPPIPSNLYLDKMRNFHEGTLTLVDLAGSEHRIDSMYHSADRRKEGAYINASLMALKECIRARSMKSNMAHQYRKSKLTMALKQSFTLPAARTAVISCVSPASKDTEHSLNTLRHACIMDGQESAIAGNETRFVTGGEVETVQIGEINTYLLSKKAREAKKAGEEHEAKTSNGNVFVDDSRELTEVEKSRIRRENEKRSIAQMDPKFRRILKESRKEVNNNERQMFRMKIPAEGLSSYIKQLAAAELPTMVVQSSNAQARPNSASRADGNSKNNSNSSSSNGSGQQQSEYVRNIVSNRPQSSGRMEGGGNKFGSPSTPNSSDGRPASSSKRAPVARASASARDPYESNYADAKKPFEELQRQVYGNDGMVTDDPIQRRQLVTLMRMHGYSEGEIKDMAPPSPTDIKLRQRAAKKKSASGSAVAADEESPCADSSRRDSRGNRRRSQSPVSASEAAAAFDADEGVSGAVLLYGRGPSKSGATATQQHQLQQQQLQQQQQAAAAAVQSDYDTRNSRQQAAKERRLRQEEERRQALQNKIKEKHGSSSAIVSSTSNAINGSGIDNPAILHRKEEIAKLEEMLFTCDDLSAAAIFAINKQISVHRAALLREQRNAAAAASTGGLDEEQQNEQAFVGNTDQSQHLPKSPSRYEPSIRSDSGRVRAPANVSSGRSPLSPPSPPSDGGYIPSLHQEQAAGRATRAFDNNSNNNSNGNSNSSSSNETSASSKLKVLKVKSKKAEWVNVADDLELEHKQEQEKLNQEAAAAAAAAVRKIKAKKKPQPEWQPLIDEKQSSAFEYTPEPEPAPEPAPAPAPAPVPVPAPAIQQRLGSPRSYGNNSSSTQLSSQQYDYQPQVPSIASYPNPTQLPYQEFDGNSYYQQGVSNSRNHDYRDSNQYQSYSSQHQAAYSSNYYSNANYVGHQPSGPATSRQQPVPTGQVSAYHQGGQGSQGSQYSLYTQPQHQQQYQHQHQFAQPQQFQSHYPPQQQQQQQAQQQQAPMYYGRRRAGVPAGAAAAPFANEYTEDK